MTTAPATTFAASLDYSARLAFGDDKAERDEAMKRAINKLLLTYTHGASDYYTHRWGAEGMERYAIIYHRCGQHRLPYKHWEYVSEHDMKRGFESAMFSIHYRTKVHGLAVVDFSERTIQKIDQDGNKVGPLLPYGPDLHKRQFAMLEEQGIMPWDYRDPTMYEGALRTRWDLNAEDMNAIERLAWYVVNTSVVLQRPYWKIHDCIPPVPRYCIAIGKLDGPLVGGRDGMMLCEDQHEIEHAVENFPKARSINDLYAGTRIQARVTVTLDEPQPHGDPFGSRSYKAPW